MIRFRDDMYERKIVVFCEFLFLILLEKKLVNVFCVILFLKDVCFR